DAMGSRERVARRRHEGDEPGDAFERRHHAAAGAAASDLLHAVDDGAVLAEREPRQGEGGPVDVPRQALAKEVVVRRDGHVGFRAALEPLPDGTSFWTRPSG